jgi:hypothetical protein
MTGRTAPRTGAPQEDRVPDRQRGCQAITALDPASRQRTGLLPDLAAPAAGTGVLPMTRTAAQAGNRQIWQAGT